MGNWIHYSSLYTGHPTLSGTAGDLTALLQACLVDGTTTQSVTSITRSGATATVTTGAHGIPSGQTGWKTISGAVESDYNGTYLVTSTSSTTFTYTVSNSPTTPATGTILHQTPAAGWTAPYSGTNKKVFYMGSGALARKYYRVNDSGAGTGGAKEALIRGFNTMTDVDTGLNPFPTGAQVALTENSEVIRKSAAASATTRVWHLFADDRSAVLVIAPGDAAGVYCVSYWGEYYTRASGDTTCAILSARSQENSSTYGAEYSMCCESSANTAIGTISWPKYTCGDSSGFNVSTTAGLAAQVFTSGASGMTNGPIPYPNPVDGGLYLNPLLLYRNVTTKPSPIGFVRGVYAVNHAPTNFTDGDTFTGSGDYSGRSFILFKTVGTGYSSTEVFVVENNTNPPFSS